MLTPRQLELIPLLTYSSRQIAERLNIKYGTVKNHLTGIYRELLGDYQEREEGTDRVRALMVALRTGIIWAVEPGPKRYGGEI